LGVGGGWAATAPPPAGGGHAAQPRVSRGCVLASCIYVYAIGYTQQPMD